MGQEFVLEKPNLHVANRTYSSGKIFRVSGFQQVICQNMEPCLLNLVELCHQFFRDAPVKYVNVLPCPHLIVALWEHALSHLNTPAKSNLSRTFLQLLGNGNHSRMAQNVLRDGPVIDVNVLLDPLLVGALREHAVPHLNPPPATCAGVFPSFSAVETTTGCASTLPTAFTDAVPGEPNGDLVCCHTGWHSTWSTAGGTRATASRSSSFLLEKLLTPMARALPESWSFSIAAHVAGISVGRTFCPPKPAPFFILTGQWI
uniref:Uncharacterized protein n=2 Tax=Oryza TaxID=4527 RepID=A0A0D3G8I4_9ORYZ